MLRQGKISAIIDDGARVTVTPHCGGMVSPPLVVPAALIGALPVDTHVIYNVFPDNSGIVISRADGAVNSDAVGGAIEVTEDGDAIIIRTRREE